MILEMYMRFNGVRLRYLLADWLGGLLTKCESLGTMLRMQGKPIRKNSCALCCCQRNAQVSSGTVKAGSLS
jgi:hypothetical protein